MVRHSLAVVISLIVSIGCNTTQAQLNLEVAFPNLSFSRPVDFQHSGDGTNRLFVVEQAGLIRVFENAPTVQTTSVFLDIRDRVNSSGNEEGLLGLAFHPDYKNNGYFFVNYTANPPRRTIIARYKVSKTNPDVADKSSEEIFLTFSQPFSNHNGGQITFGPDGFLYIGTGDGGSGGDPQGNGQNRSTMLGKILRIDVDSEQSGKKYAIPSDNPFAGNALGYMEEIYAYGLRNPWRFSFDPETGWLWAGDVGQNLWEEVDVIQKGKNYGWNIMEGFHCYSPSSGCDTSGLVKPIVEYDHNAGISITGGHVYRGQRVPELFGAYIYGDFGSKRIWSLRFDGNGLAVNAEIIPANAGVPLSSFGIDENRELYLCSFDGKVYRFTPTTTRLPGDENFLPKGLMLEQNFPNPVRAHEDALTTFNFFLPTAADISIVLCDIVGREVGIIFKGFLAGGRHSVKYSLAWLPTGSYSYSLSSAGVRINRQLQLLR